MHIHYRISRDIMMLLMITGIFMAELIAPEYQSFEKNRRTHLRMSIVFLAKPVIHVRPVCSSYLRRLKHPDACNPTRVHVATLPSRSFLVLLVLTLSRMALPVCVKC